jgi:hypothetical protein
MGAYMRSDLRRVGAFPWMGMRLVCSADKHAHQDSEAGEILNLLMAYHHETEATNENLGDHTRTVSCTRRRRGRVCGASTSSVSKDRALKRRTDLLRASGVPLGKDTSLLPPQEKLLAARPRGGATAAESYDGRSTNETAPTPGSPVRWSNTMIRVTSAGLGWSKHDRYRSTSFSSAHRAHKAPSPRRQGGPAAVLENRR